VTGRPPTTVLGSGIAGTACALFAARHGPVVLAGNPPPRWPTAVESVPAATLTLLLELGIVPRELDVPPLIRRRTGTWEHPAPTHSDGRACAHLDRGALLAALWRRVAAEPRIAVVPRGPDRAAAPGRLVDASGTRALTAVTVARRPGAWTASTLTVARGNAEPGLYLAAAPDGYGYRLGSANLLTLGWVGSRPPPRDGPELWQRIDSAAGWLLTDLPGPLPGPTHRRPAGLAVPMAAPDTVPVGDAALTRDALASQGTAIALSDACLAADPRTSEAQLAARRTDALDRSVRQLAEVLAACRHADEPTWASYRRWLAELTPALRDGLRGGDRALRSAPARS
jgi:2-polyprenyl-6-methoxyphenol hydroxylase-like FAD-dependent oxidoreductase